MKGDEKYVKKGIRVYVKKENYFRGIYACWRLFVSFGTIRMLLLYLSSATISRSLKNERIGV